MRRAGGSFSSVTLAGRALAFLAVAALSGCVGGFPTLTEVANRVGIGQKAPAMMQLAGGQMVVAGPKGFCVDVEASHEAPEGAFVLMGSCASLSHNFTAARPKKPAILTATVFGGQDADTDISAAFPEMAKFLSSKPGRAALSRNGRANSVKIIQITSLDGVMYVHASDSAPLQGRDVEAEYWRAIFGLKGKIVTLTVLSLVDLPMDSETKRDLLDQFVAALQAANGT